MPILKNSDSAQFPLPTSASGDGLVAIGGQLSVPLLLRAYSNGIFPWSEEPVTWWSPHPRAIFEIPQFQVPESLKRLKNKMKRPGLSFSFDQAFPEVIEACAAPVSGRKETWISPGFIASYCELHRSGHAHSVEVWQDQKLVGGLYGVAIGGLFAGESMFHRVSDASKMALVKMMQHLESKGFVLFDSQVATPVTLQMGAIEVPRHDYLLRLKKALALKVTF